MCVCVCVCVEGRAVCGAQSQAFDDMPTVIGAGLCSDATMQPCVPWQALSASRCTKRSVLCVLKGIMVL